MPDTNIPQNDRNVKEIKEKLERWAAWVRAIIHALEESRAMMEDALKELDKVLGELGGKE